MLSICAICKNEEKNIVAFINSWLPICDEIIIVDTGSNDNTIKLANALKHPRKKFRIVKSLRQYDQSERPTQDFADARNESISYCSGDWIMWADLDDRLDINSIERIKALVAEAPAKVAHAFQIASDVGNEQWSHFMQVRLFPANPLIKFDGRIHEKVSDSLISNGFKVNYEPEVIVAHLGYADLAVRKQKAIRNLELLDREEQSEQTLIQCGDSFCVLEHFEVALSCYEQAIKVSLRVHTTRELLAENIVKCKVFLGRLDEAQRDVTSQLLMDSSAEWFYWAGEIAFLKADYTEAYNKFSMVEHMESTMGEKNSSATILLSKSKERLKQLKGE